MMMTMLMMIVLAMVIMMRVMMLLMVLVMVAVMVMVMLVMRSLQGKVESAGVVATGLRAAAPLRQSVPRKTELALGNPLCEPEVQRTGVA